MKYWVKIGIIIFAGIWGSQVGWAAKSPSPKKTNAHEFFQNFFKQSTQSTWIKFHPNKGLIINDLSLQSFDQHYLSPNEPVESIEKSIHDLLALPISNYERSILSNEYKKFLKTGNPEPFQNYLKSSIRNSKNDNYWRNQLLGVSILINDAKKKYQKLNYTMGSNGSFSIEVKIFDLKKSKDLAQKIIKSARKSKKLKQAFELKFNSDSQGVIKLTLIDKEPLAEIWIDYHVPTEAMINQNSQSLSASIQSIEASQNFRILVPESKASDFKLNTGLDVEIFKERFMDLPVLVQSSKWLQLFNHLLISAKHQNKEAKRTLKALKGIDSINDKLIENPDYLMTNPQVFKKDLENLRIKIKMALLNRS